MEGETEEGAAGRVLVARALSRKGGVNRGKRWKAEDIERERGVCPREFVSWNYSRFRRSFAFQNLAISAKSNANGQYVTRKTKAVRHFECCGEFQTILPRTKAPTKK